MRPRVCLPYNGGGSQWSGLASFLGDRKVGKHWVSKSMGFSPASFSLLEPPPHFHNPPTHTHTYTLLVFCLELLLEGIRPTAPVRTPTHSKGVSDSSLFIQVGEGAKETKKSREL